MVFDLTFNLYYWFAFFQITFNSKGGVPDMVYKFVPLESIASINDGQIIGIV